MINNTYMKKSLTLLTTLFLIFPFLTSAATFSFSPNTNTYLPSQSFSVDVYVNPDAGEEITTAKLVLSFPTQILKINSFTLASGWVALTQPGYDSLDNTKGELIKTGGFPGKVTTKKLFGTITFSTQNEGTAKLVVGSNSLLLNPTNVNKYKNGSDANFVVAKPVPVVEPAPVINKPVPVPPKLPVVKVKEEPEIITPSITATTSTTTATSSPATVDEDQNESDQIAAVVNADDASNTSYPRYYVLLAVLGLLVLVLIGRRLFISKIKK